MPLRLPSARSPAWVLAETGTAALLSFLSLLLVARAIGPEEAGKGALAIAAYLLLDLVGANLFTDALVQRSRLLRREVASAVTAQGLAGIGTGALLLLAAPQVADWMEAPGTLPLMQALAGLLPFSALSGAAAGLALRDQRYRLLALRVLIGLPIALLLALLAADAGHGAWAMVVLQAASTVAAFLIMVPATLIGQRLRPRLSRVALGRLWPVAGPQVLSVVVLAGRYRLFLLALGTQLAEAAVAVCNVAFRLLDSMLAVVWSSVFRLALPRFSRLQADRAALAEAYGEIAELNALVGMPIAAGVAMTAPGLLPALLGPAWGEAAAATQVVGWAAVAGFLWGDTSSLFVALGRTRRNLVAALLGLLVPIAALLLIQPTSPVGAAWCWATGALAVGPLVAAMALREIGRSPLWLLRRAAPALLATAAMAAVVLALRGEGTGLPALAGPILAGASVYLAVAWIGIGRRLPRALGPLPAMPARAGSAPGEAAAVLRPAA